MHLIAEIISAGHRYLGEPSKERLPLIDSLHLVRQALAKHTEGLQQSDQNQIIESVDLVFTATGTRSRELGIGRGVPVWTERKKHPEDRSSDEFEPVPVSNLHSLEDRRTFGSEQRVAFFGNSENETFIRLAHKESNVFRVYFDPEESFQAELSGASHLPANFNYLVMLEFAALAIPFIQTRAATRRLEISPDEWRAFDNLQVKTEREILEWKERFNNYAYRSRTAQTRRARRSSRFHHNPYGD